MERRIIIAILLFLNLGIVAQDLSSLRTKTLHITTDTLSLDTLAIMPGSLFMFDVQQNRIPDSLYQVLPAEGSVVIDPARVKGEITVKYRVLSPEIFLPYYHKDPSSLRPKPDGIPADPFRISSADLPRGSYYSYSELNKRGSLSRGITFGNSQDVVVNSNLNLQLTGKLSDNMNIIAAISDNNIPIQPEGYSQQISVSYY